MSDYIKREDAIKQAERCWIGSESWIGELCKQHLKNLPSSDVVEIGKPYFYEEGYVLKDFHNDGDRYFVIERAVE